jgi:hypothetical protein
LENPTAVSTEAIALAAIANAELAPALIEQIALRQDIAQLSVVLQHYAEHPTFEYCVSRIESTLPTEVGDGVLMKLAVDLDSSESGGITNFTEKMRAEKRTDRSLADYQHLLQLDEENLQHLHNRELLLIGGGESPVKSELTQKGIDCHVVNIDPMAAHDPHNADEIVATDFLHAPQQPQRFAEAWALHSLPTYAFHPDQVVDFYAQAVGSVQTGGTLRVMPIDGFSDAFSPSMRLTRRPVSNASLHTIERMAARTDLFQIEGFTRTHRGPLGQKTEMHGVEIRIIGDANAREQFFTAAQ